MKFWLLIFVVGSNLFANQRAERSLTTGRAERDANYFQTKRMVPDAAASKPQIVRDAKYKIAILDTGYDHAFASARLKLCPGGSFDYATKQPHVGSAPEEHHGTYVASIIADELEKSDYCAYIFQISGPLGEFATENEIDALNRARKLGVVAVNLSFRSGFYEYSEFTALEQLSNAGIKIFAAAGNEHQNFNIACATYPACYDLANIVVVGALTADGDTPSSYSNFGNKVDLWYPGIYQGTLVTARGSSFAAPRALGQYVRWLSRKQ